MIKIALIGSGISSGGLVNMLSDFLSYCPKGVDVALFCSRDFASQFSNINPSINVIETETIVEGKFAQLVKRCYSSEFVRLVHEYHPDAVFFITGTSKIGFDDYETFIVLNNQLYTNFPRVLKQKSLKVVLSTLINACKFRLRVKKIKHIFFSSNYSQKESEGVLHINDSTVVPFACNSVFFVDQPGVMKENVGERVSLLNIGSIIPYKNQKTVIEGAGMLKAKGVDLKITFIGRVLSKKYYRECIEAIKAYDLMNNVEFIEWMTPTQIIEQIDGCDIYINSSETDTCATSVEEGMARCKPIIASDTLFNREMLKDAGLYFDLYNPVTLTEAISRYLCSPNLMKKMAIRGYHYSREWSLIDTAQEYYNNIIKKLLKE